MTVKEYTEAYIQIMESRRESLAFSLNQTAREMDDDTQNMIFRDRRNARHIAEYSLKAIENETRLEVCEEIIKELKRFLKAIEDGSVEA